MTDKYNRTICGFCPAKDDCDALRAVPPPRDSGWGSLPRKCLLAESLIERHARGVVDIPICPRCESEEATVDVDRQWKMGLGKSSTQLTYKLHCPFCGLDSLAEV